MVRKCPQYYNNIICLSEYICNLYFLPGFAMESGEGCGDTGISENKKRKNNAYEIHIILNLNAKTFEGQFKSSLHGPLSLGGRNISTNFA